MSLQPFLKWAGGKRWLVSRKDISLFSVSYDRFIEPFLGGGSVFFKLLPKKAILSDMNPDLIETYQALKNNWEAVQDRLRSYQKKHSKSYYYKEREKLYINQIDRAAKFIYLNRVCWNGLYRVNTKGYFNVPIGTKSSVLLESDNFGAISEALKTTNLIHGDFEKIIDLTIKGDFLFIDPPYTIKHNNNGFVKYNEKIFKWHDQERLRDAVSRAHKRHVKILITNAYYKEIEELYEKIGFKCEQIIRASVIAGKSSSRGVYKELVIKNY